MHGTVERPVAIKGEIKIRPMIYVALAYDHRIIDGRGAVLFLRRIKDCVEDPYRMLLDVYPLLLKNQNSVIKLFNI